MEGNRSSNQLWGSTAISHNRSASRSSSLRYSDFLLAIIKAAAAIISKMGTAKKGTMNIGSIRSASAITFASPWALPMRWPRTSRRWVLIPYGVHVTSVQRSRIGSICKSLRLSGFTILIWSIWYVEVWSNTVRVKTSPSANLSKSENSFARGSPLWPESTQCVPSVLSATSLVFGSKEAQPTGRLVPSKCPMLVCSTLSEVPW